MADDFSEIEVVATNFNWRQSGGTTAVAVSLDVDLPEGRRIMHLSPYYLTLRTAVRDLRWEDVRQLRFEVPPDENVTPR